MMSILRLLNASSHRAKRIEKMKPTAKTMNKPPIWLIDRRIFSVSSIYKEQLNV